MPAFRFAVLLVAALIPVADVLLAAAQERKPRKVAFLVGVGTYDHNFADLGAAPVNDVTELGKALAGGGFEVHTLAGNGKGRDRATKANIEARFKELLEGGEKLRNTDTLMVVLCGHGVQDGEPLFCPVDALPDRPATMVPLNKLIKDADPFGATCLFLVDACRDDPNRGRRTGIQGKKAELPAKTAVLFSCGSGQSAYQDKATGHGVFTFAVLKTLRDGGGTNWDRLVTGVKEAFETDDIKKLVPAGQTQTPVLATGELGFTPLLAKGPVPGEERPVEVAHGVKMVFCWIPPGKVTLGSPAAEREREDGENEHDFEARGFWLGKYEVTQDEWVNVTGGKNPSTFTVGRPGATGIADTKKFPVESVSWDDCQRFLEKVNAKPGAGRALAKAGKFALPREDEWEYACRGGRGNKQPFYWGSELNGTQANCNGLSQTPYGTAVRGQFLIRPCAVDDKNNGKYEKHPWGLCHMHGNVAEWCENKYKATNYRVLCGGSWLSSASYCRAALRYRFDPTRREADWGFRVAFRPE